MAVRDFKLSTTVSLKFKVGVDSKGNDIIKIVNLKKVKTTATHQDIFDVALVLSPLVEGAAVGVLRQDVSELINE